MPNGSNQTVRLYVDYEAGNEWWESGGLKLWESLCEQVGADSNADEIHVTEDEGRAFLAQAYWITGWSVPCGAGYINPVGIDG